MRNFFYLKVSTTPLCIEHDIIQMATASIGGAHTKGQIFHDSGAQIGLYLIDDVVYVCGLRLVGIDLRFKKTPQEKVQRGQIARSRWPVQVTFARDDHVRKLLVQNIHRCVCCVH